MKDNKYHPNVKDYHYYKIPKSDVNCNHCQHYGAGYNCKLLKMQSLPQSYCKCWRYYKQFTKTF